MDKSINFEDYVECDENHLLSEVRISKEIFEDINIEDVSKSMMKMRTMFLLL